ncbi:GDSL-like Lipase/Acylhydrolase family [Prosthecobacter debontii]|uniref:GDSL-like Lipase/Acylhydrolase family n=2 Tax=Prosthecobacter debontii TaxID=48467 RepID=A0A1T4XZZ4_9BACT|nr:GDSL-like Lipase/Acylhydrolase family [Prosthecobacter debontii]
MLARMAENNDPTNKASDDVIDPGPAPVSFEELQQRVIEGTIREDELAAYFIEVPSSPETLQPEFVLNPALVEVPLEEATLESARLMNTANAWCYMMRKNAYYRRINQPGGNQLIRIIAEGDSWFQYPFILHDVIDHIADRKDVAVRCFSAAGDVLSNMVARPQFLEAIRVEKPKYFLLSGGGNDLVDGDGLRKLLKKYDPALKPEQYLNAEYAAFKARLLRLYKDILEMIYREDPTVVVICHGYAYAIPDSKRGGWLGKPMEELGIGDKDLQYKIMTVIVNDINEAVAKAVEQSPGTAHFVDNRKTLPKDPKCWHDEFHPTSEWFGKVAAGISALIKK